MRLWGNKRNYSAKRYNKKISLYREVVYGCYNYISSDVVRVSVAMTENFKTMNIYRIAIQIIFYAMAEYSNAMNIFRM